MKKIYFVRHGQTVWNKENKVCGITDSELTELGHAQAEESGRKILEMGIYADEILSSPLSRALDTARHISDLTGFPVRVEPRLIEQNFGKWESMPRNSKDFLEAKAYFAQRFDGGESLLQLSQRIYNLLDELKQSDKTYILVAHNGVARMVHTYFFDMTNEEYAGFKLQNCEVREYFFR